MKPIHVISIIILFLGISCKSDVKKDLNSEQTLEYKDYAFDLRCRQKVCEEPHVLITYDYMSKELLFFSENYLLIDNKNLEDNSSNLIKWKVSFEEVNEIIALARKRNIDIFYAANESFLTDYLND